MNEGYDRWREKYQVLQVEREQVSRRSTGLAWRLGAINDAELVRRHRAWSSQPLWLYFSKNGETGPTFSRSLASKRGNEVYSFELRRKLAALTETVEPKIRVSSTRTNAVFVTLTDPHLGARGDAWLSIGKRFNLFMANLRRQYRRVTTVRSWESTQNGWPHVHALLIFEEHDFSTQLRWSDSKKRMISRVNGSRSWKRHWLGHMDVEGCETVKGAVYYIAKEVLKYGADLSSVQGEKGALTQAICWALGRRSYSIGRELTRALAGAGVDEGEDAKRRLDASPRVSLTQTLPAKSPWKFEGLIEASPGESTNPWVQRVDTLPEGLRRPRRRGEIQDPSGEQGAFIARGALASTEHSHSKWETCFSRCPGFERPSATFPDGEHTTAKVHDELTTKRRGSLERLWRGEPTR